MCQVYYHRVVVTHAENRISQYNWCRWREAHVLNLIVTGCMCKLLEYYWKCYLSVLQFQISDFFSTVTLKFIIDQVGSISTRLQKWKAKM